MSDDSLYRNTVKVEMAGDEDENSAMDISPEYLIDASPEKD